MKTDIYAFVNKLKESKIFFELSAVRDGYLMVNISVPGQRWEVEFSEDGSIEVEVFKSDGNILGENALDELLRKFRD